MIFFTLIFCCLTAGAENVPSLLRDGMRWYLQGETVGKDYPTLREFCEIAGDTVVNGTDCKILNINNFTKGIINRIPLYEENGKIFSYDRRNERILLLDFSVNTGDELPVKMWDGGWNEVGKFHVTEVRDVFIEGCQRKVIYSAYKKEDGKYHVVNIWVEGIGAYYGVDRNLLNFVIPTDGSSYTPLTYDVYYKNNRIFGLEDFENLKREFEETGMIEKRVKYTRSAEEYYYGSEKNISGLAGEILFHENNTVTILNPVGINPSYSSLTGYLTQTDNGKELIDISLPQKINYIYPIKIGDNYLTKEVETCLVEEKEDNGGVKKFNIVEGNLQYEIDTDGTVRMISDKSYENGGKVWLGLIIDSEVGAVAETGTVYKVFEAESQEPVINTEFQTWSLMQHTDGMIPREVQVAIENDKLYIKGLFEEFPDSYITGNISGNSVIFDKDQYIGLSNRYFSYCYLYGSQLNESLFGPYYFGSLNPGNITMDYKEGILEYSGEGKYVAAGNSAFAMIFLKDFTIAKDYNGVQPITEEEDAVTPRYYNLQGIELSSPAKGDIVIEKRGVKAARKIKF